MDLSKKIPNVMKRYVFNAIFTHNGVDGANNVKVNGTNLYPTKHVNSISDVTLVLARFGELTNK